MVADDERPGGHFLRPGGVAVVVRQDGQRRFGVGSVVGAGTLNAVAGARCISSRMAEPALVRARASSQWPALIRAKSAVASLKYSASGVPHQPASVPTTATALYPYATVAPRLISVSMLLVSRRAAANALA